MTLFLQVDHACHANSRPKRKDHYHLLTFDKDVDSRCFPLSYNLRKVESGFEPDPSVSCDSPVSCLQYEGYSSSCLFPFISCDLLTS